MGMSAFEVLGPIMVGPSSSHTAGALRIARVARLLAPRPLARVDFTLFNSFSRTHRGHGTDKALIAGLMDMAPDDVRLRDSFIHAEAAGLRFRFGEAQLRQAHPNTVVLNLKGVSGRALSMQAASVGGGNIRVDV
ncbi:MAG: serine dehydratase, partial [Atopobiaceae bacterium]|nr:serine dehydratase [Atopobiaceae bacterium]